jgi:hypothetical protein
VEVRADYLGIDAFRQPLVDPLAVGSFADR